MNITSVNKTEGGKILGKMRKVLRFLKDLRSLNVDHYAIESVKNRVSSMNKEQRISALDEIMSDPTSPASKQKALGVTRYTKTILGSFETKLLSPKLTPEQVTEYKKAIQQMRGVLNQLDTILALGDDSVINEAGKPSVDDVKNTVENMRDTLKYGEVLDGNERKMDRAGATPEQMLVYKQAINIVPEHKNGAAEITALTAPFIKDLDAAIIKSGLPPAESSAMLREWANDPSNPPAALISTLEDGSPGLRSQVEVAVQTIAGRPDLLATLNAFDENLVKIADEGGGGGDVGKVLTERFPQLYKGANMTGIDAMVRGNVDRLHARTELKDIVKNVREAKTDLASVQAELATVDVDILLVSMELRGFEGTHLEQNPDMAKRLESLRTTLTELEEKRETLVDQKKTAKKSIDSLTAKQDELKAKAGERFSIDEVGGDGSDIPADIAEGLRTGYAELDRALQSAESGMGDSIDSVKNAISATAKILAYIKENPNVLQVLEDGGTILATLEGKLKNQTTKLKEASDKRTQEILKDYLTELKERARMVRSREQSMIDGVKKDREMGGIIGTIASSVSGNDPFQHQINKSQAILDSLAIIESKDLQKAETSFESGEDPKVIMNNLISAKKGLVGLNIVDMDTSVFDNYENNFYTNIAKGAPLTAISYGTSTTIGVVDDVVSAVEKGIDSARSTKIAQKNTPNDSDTNTPA